MDNYSENYVAMLRIICFINFFDIAKINLDSKNIYFNKDIIIERNIFNLDKLKSKLQKFNYTFEEKDIFIHWNDMNNPGIDTQSLVNFATRNSPTGKIIPSAIQEEVLFCIWPQLYPAMLICQKVYEN